MTKIVSLFSGAGGLDLGFTRAGFEVPWANEHDKQIWETYEHNHPDTRLDRRSITDIPSADIPDADGIIGGPPCQSWSIAGAQRGEDDARGQLFWEFVRIIKDKQPKFFLAENVRGILAPKHRDAWLRLLDVLKNAGYRVDAHLLNAYDYGVPQTRQRVIIVGYRQDLGLRFSPPTASPERPSQWDAIGDLPPPIGILRGKPVSEDHHTPHHNHEYRANNIDPEWNYECVFRRRDWNEPSFTIPAHRESIPFHPASTLPNHEYETRKIHSGYDSSNRRTDWDEPAKTLSATDSSILLHPSSPPRNHEYQARQVHLNFHISAQKRDWNEASYTIPAHEDGVPLHPASETKEDLYRRMSVREAARLQTFPDNFIFFYRSLITGYRMVGNAVPVMLAWYLAMQIKRDLA